LALIRTVHRYRCKNVDCGWEGVVRSSAASCAATARTAVWRAGAARALLAGGVILLALAMIRFGGGSPPQVIGPQACDLSAAMRFVAAGESHDGFELPLDDPAPAATALVLRSGCAWGVPGRSPYKGSISEALTAAKLPHEVIRQIETRIENGDNSGRVAISRDEIRSTDGSRSFDTRIAAMGFGRTLCFGTQVNFAAGHVEHADLYDATDASGRRHAVMVPYVCGNVSVLAERAERGESGKGTGPLASAAPIGPSTDAPGTRSGRAARFGAAPPGVGAATLNGGNGGVWVAPETFDSGGGSGGSGGGCVPGDDGPRSVPEPATLAAVLIALAMMDVGRRLARSRRPR